MTEKLIPYRVNGKMFDVPESSREKFEKRYPSATIEMHVGDEIFDVPFAQEGVFRNRYPDAVYGLKPSALTEDRTGFFESLGKGLAAGAVGATKDFTDLVNVFNTGSGTPGAAIISQGKFDEALLAEDNPLYKTSANLGDTQEKLSREADPTAGESSFWDLIKEGKLGTAMQKAVASGAESLPMMFFSRTPIGAALYGSAMAASNYIDETQENPDIPSWKRAINAAGTAALELAIERLGGPLKAKGKLTKEALTKFLDDVAKEGTETIAKRIFKGIGGVVKEGWEEGWEEVGTSFGNDVLGTALDAIDGDADYGIKAQWEQLKNEDPSADAWDFAKMKGAEYMDSYIGGTLAGWEISGAVKGINKGVSLMRGETRTAVQAARENGAALDYADMYDVDALVAESTTALEGTLVDKDGNSIVDRAFIDNITADEAYALAGRDDLSGEQRQAFFNYAQAKAASEGLNEKLDNRLNEQIDAIRGRIDEATDNNGLVIVGTVNGRAVYVKDGFITTNGRVATGQTDTGYTFGPVIVVDSVTGEKTTVNGDQIQSAMSHDANELFGGMESAFREREAEQRNTARNTVSPRAKLNTVIGLQNRKMLIDLGNGLIEVEVMNVDPMTGEVMIKGKKGDLGGQAITKLGSDVFYDSLYRDENGEFAFVDEIDTPTEPEDVPTDIPVAPETTAEEGPAAETPAEVTETPDYRGETYTILQNGVPVEAEVISQDEASDTVVYRIMGENGQPMLLSSTIGEFGSAIDAAANPTPIAPEVEPEPEVEAAPETPADVEPEAPAAPIEPDAINWDALFDSDPEAYFAELQNQFGEEALDILNEEIEAAQNELDALGKAKTKTQNERLENRKRKAALQSKISALNEMVARLSQTVAPETAPVAPEVPAVPETVTPEPVVPVAPTPVEDPIKEAQKREKSLATQLKRIGIPHEQKQDMAFNAGKAVADFFATREEYEAYAENATDFGEYNADFERGVDASFANRQQNTGETPVNSVPLESEPKGEDNGKANEPETEDTEGRVDRIGSEPANDEGSEESGTPSEEVGGSEADNTGQVEDKYPVRNGDVTPQILKETFGMRDVASDISTNNLNSIYDFMMEMAKILGISPKSIGHGATLGAENYNSPHTHIRAQYSYRQAFDGTVKNPVLRFRNAALSSIAHEWWHSLDNALAYYETGKTHHMTTNSNDSNFTGRAETLKAVKDVLKAINKSGHKDRLNIVLAYNPSFLKYSKQKDEMSARAFEEYILMKFAEAGIEVGSPTEFFSNRPNAEEMKVIAPAFDKLFEVLQEKEGKTPGTSVLFQIGEMVDKNTEASQLATENIISVLRDSKIEVVMLTDENVEQMIPLSKVDGTIYGWTDGKKIYLTEAGINPNTPVHEYTHLWAKAMMQKNPKGWQSIKDLLRGTPVWNEVLNDPNYSSIHSNEDLVASEVLSRISGTQNAAKLEQMAQQMIDEAKGTARKLEARGLIQNMRDALNKFWNWVGTNLFGIENFESIEQVTDRVLWDLLNNTDLGITEEKKSADSDRSGVISGTTSSTSLPLGGKQHLSTHHLTHQESDANLRTNFETIKRKVQKFINSGYEIKDKHKIHDETQLVQKLASIFGFEKSETSISYYGEYETSIDIDGKKYKVRLSNHKASGEWMSKGEFDERVSLVIEFKDTEGREGGDKYFVEYVTDLKGNHTIEEVTKVITDSVFSLLNGGKVERSLFDEYNKRNLSAKVRDIEAEMQKIKDDAISDGTFMKAPNGKSTKLTERQWLLVRTESFKDWFGDWEYNPEEASKVVDENGEPMVVYHGSPYGAITEFDRKGHSVSGLREFGTYFSTSKELAQLYAYARQQAKGDIEKYKLEKARLDAIIFNNDTPPRIALDAFDELDRLEESQKPKVYEVFLNIRKPKVFDAERTNGWNGWHKLKQDVGYDIKSGVEAIEAISGHNSAAIMDETYDGIIAENMADVHSEEGLEELMGDVFLVFDETPSNIKSATDNVGTFDADDPDIRYRKAEAQNAAVDYLAGEPRLRAIENAVNEEAATLGVKVTYKTREQMPNGHKNDKGYYVPKTGEVVVCTENASSIADAIQTILHEAVAHKGLRQLMGDGFNEFINRVYESLDAETKAKVDALAESQYNGNKAVAMEEYMATLAESTDFKKDTLWDKIKSIFEDIINAILGRNDIKIGDNELRYILRASYNNMINPREMDTVRGWAQDQMIREEYKINDTTPDILSRTGIDPSAVSREAAKAVYDKVVSDTWQEMQRQFQDAYQPVRIAIDAIQQETGNIPIEDYENYLLIQNQSSSRSRVEIDEFAERYYSPIVEQVNKIIDTIMESRGWKVSDADRRAEVYGELRQYLIAKHGLERNEYYQTHKMRNLTAAEKKKEYALAKQTYDTEVANINADTSLTDAERELKLRDAKDAYDAAILEINTREVPDIRDYSGLTSLFGLEPKKFRQAEAEARNLVDNAENMFGPELDILWERINKATDKTLRHSYESGIISRQQYNDIKDMFEFYIPLRGFEDITAEEVYSYSRFEGNRFSPAVQTAKGRTSVANDPLAYIMSMAESEITQGNKNRAKQALYNYLLNRTQTDVDGNQIQNSLMQVESVWYVKSVDATGNTVMTMAAPDHASGETYEEFEARMEALAATGDAAKSKKGKIDIGMRFQKPANMDAHYVHLKVNGVDKAIYINGDPKATDAINGTYKKDRNELSEKMGKWNRFLSSMFTNYSLEFTVRNYFRDMLYSHINIGIKESDHAYRKKFRQNWRHNNFRSMVKMLKAFRAGEYDGKALTEDEAAFVEFMMNGGQTGYVVLNKVETHKADLEKAIERMQKGLAKGGVKDSTVFKYTLGGIELLNEASELVTRFAAFKTSRDMGRSVVQSISDAKEVTVNFNTKGAQDGKGWIGMAARYFGWSKYFFNASVQGVQNLKAMANANKLKFGGVVGGIVATGFLMPIITGAIAQLLGGDEEEYWNIPEYDRQNNFCIPVGNGKYAKIPLPVGFREVYAIGDMVSAMMFDKKFAKDVKSVGTDIANKIASIVLPINPLEGTANGLSIWHTLAYTAAPSSAQLLIQNLTNTDWKGAPLQKEYTYNENDPQWMKAFAGNPDWMQMLSKWCNEHINADGDYKGWDWSPEKLDNTLSNLFGGVYTLIKKTGKSISMIWNEENRNMQNAPVAGVFLGSGIDSEDRFVTDAYYEMMDYYDSQVGYIKRRAARFGYDLDEVFKKEKGKHHPKMNEIYSNKNFDFMQEWYKGNEDLEKLNDKIKNLEKKIAGKENPTQSDLNKLARLKDQFAVERREFVDDMLELD